MSAQKKATEFRKHRKTLARSYRKPIAVDGYGSPVKRILKRIANKRARRDLQLADGGSYKKASNSWDICDYKFQLEDTKRNRSK